MRSKSIYLARQPLVNRAGELAGFELLFRSTAENAANADDNLFATSTVIVNTFTEIGLHQVVGDVDAYIKVDNQFLFTDLVESLPADRVVLELLEHSMMDDATLERCRALRAMGYRVAVDDFVGNLDELGPLLSSVDLVKVNFQRLDPLLIPEIVTALRGHAVKLVAEKIETPEQFRHARDLGIELFQGHHFARPEMLSGKRKRPAKIALLRLLAMALADEETATIEQEFKHHPTLSVNLIRLTNSAAMRSRQCVTSLRHAIILLGRRQLRVWLQLLLYTSDRENASLSSPLLQLAAVRGKLMELIAARHPGPQGAFQELAFMTGMLSLMDVVFETPHDEIVLELNLPAPVKAALLGRDGELGHLLTLTEQLEQDDSDAVRRSLSHVEGVGPQELLGMQYDAFEWANQVVSEPGAAATAH